MGRPHSSKTFPVDVMAGSTIFPQDVAPLRSKTRKGVPYTRGSDVEEQIRNLVRDGPDELVRRILSERDFAESEKLRQESTIFFIRDYHQILRPDDDTDSARQILTEELYRKSLPLIRYWAICTRGVLNSNVEDVCQRVFTRFATMLAEDSQTHEIYPLDFAEIRYVKFLRNLTRDACDGRPPPIEISIDSLDDEAGNQTLDPADRSMPVDEMLVLDSEIKSALKVLSREEREAYLLKNYHGLSQQEIAEYQRVDVRTVRYRLQRANEKLRIFVATQMGCSK
jgi:RNA polymerase sigma factor (sigma-70 family)